MNEKIGVLLIIMIAFITLPFLTMLMVFIWFLNKENSKLIYFVFFATSFLSLINITVDGNSTDYQNYLPFYSLALSNRFDDYVYGYLFSKEPLFPIMNYFLARLFGGSRVLYSIFATSFFYSLMSAAIFNFWKLLKLPWVYLCLSLSVLFFFPYIFANSANHVRQYWASAIVIFSMSKILNGKIQYWILAVLSMLIHTTSGLVVILFAVPFIGKPLRDKMLLLLFTLAILTFVSVKSLAASLFPVLEGTMLSYAASTAARGVIKEMEYSVPVMLFSIVVVSVVLLVVNLTRLRKLSAVNKIINVQAFLMAFILVNQDQGELCSRMNNYIWFFLPLDAMIVAPYLRLTSYKCKIVSFLLLLFFIYYQSCLTKNTYYCRDTMLVQSTIFFYDQCKLDKVVSLQY